jgi:diacylglycerol kinase family enzyme
MSNSKIDRIDVIATTMSGSVADWGKVGRIEGEFKKYCSGEVTVHSVDSHKEARARTAELIGQGSRMIVSAGGAGTFNSVLEGSFTAEGIPRDLRLAFLRKGSADLIGKAMGVPDDLARAVQVIYRGMIEEHSVVADVVEITGKETGTRHFIGFGGLGVFGDIPRFTESRVIKYYKGFLGTLFGDLGPFMVGINLALAKHHIDALKRRVPRFHLTMGDFESATDRFISIIILNGDLSKDFLLARGIPFGSGDFRVITIEDRGFCNSYKQLISCWTGEVFEHANKLAVRVFRTPRLDVKPRDTRPYMVNVDGLILWAKGPITYRICDQVRIVSGKRQNL